MGVIGSLPRMPDCGMEAALRPVTIA
jgi:hypothetical protein